VKTLADPLADQVHFKHVERTTIDRPRGLADIGAHKTTPRTPPDELRVFKVRARARLVEATIEGDGDIHLVIRDKHASHKMIVEFPDPSCAFRGEHATHVAQMTAARHAFENACGTPPHASFAPLTGSATIIGVAFFDLPHATPQHGVAPNNIELHPVLSFTKPTC
jgi:hypothetical protein